MFPLSDKTKCIWIYLHHRSRWNGSSAESSVKRRVTSELLLLLLLLLLFVMCVVTGSEKKRVAALCTNITSPRPGYNLLIEPAQWGERGRSLWLSAISLASLAIWLTLFCVYEALGAETRTLVNPTQGRMWTVTGGWDSWSFMSAAPVWCGYINGNRRRCHPAEPVPQQTSITSVMLVFIFVLLFEGPRRISLHTLIVKKQNMFHRCSNTSHTPECTASDFLPEIINIVWTGPS